MSSDIPRHLNKPKSGFHGKSRGVVSNQGRSPGCLISFRGAGVLGGCVISPSILHAVQKALLSSLSSFNIFPGKASLVCSCPSITWRRPSYLWQECVGGIVTLSPLSLPCPTVHNPLVHAFPTLLSQTPSWTPLPHSHTPPTCVKTRTSSLLVILAHPISSPRVMVPTTPCLLPAELETHQVLSHSLGMEQARRQDTGNLPTSVKGPLLPEGCLPATSQPRHRGDRNFSFYGTAEWLGLVFPRSIHL